MPLWDKVISNENNGKDSLLFFIPLRELNGKSINGFISCLKVNSNFHFKLLSKKDLEKTLTLNNDTQQWLHSCFNTIAYFERNINNIDSIKLKGFYNVVIKNTNLTFETNPQLTGKQNDVYFTYYIKYCASIGGNNETKTSIVFYCWNEYFVSYGGSNVSLGTSPGWYDNTGGTATGGLSSELDPNILYFLASKLNLNETESMWLLQNPLKAMQINSYLTSFEPLPQSYIDNAKYHIEQMMTNSSYGTLRSSGVFWFVPKTPLL